MIGVHEAQSILHDYACTHAHIHMQEHIETIELHAYGTNALGRVLAADVVSPVDVPEFDNSAMDGYTLHTDVFNAVQNSQSVSLMVSATVSAGERPPTLTPRTCMRIFTGAVIPEGADTVVPLEQCVYDAERNTVQFSAPFPKTGNHIRPRALNFTKGDIVFRKGTLLGMRELTLLSSIGIVTLSVVRPLRVGVCITGDELVHPGTPLMFGQIYNSNVTFLYNILLSDKFKIVKVHHLPDDYDETVHALHALSQECDIIITSGGISVGEKDYIYKCIAQEIVPDKVFIRKVAIKPGKPLTFAEYNGCPIVALPGNPLSVFITYLWFVHPFLRVLQGCSSALSHISVNPKHDAIVASDIHSFLLVTSSRDFAPSPRTQFIFASIDRGTMHVIPLQDQSSAALKNIYMADGAIIVPQNTEVSKGDTVLFWEWGSIFTNSGMQSNLPS